MLEASNPTIVGAFSKKYPVLNLQADTSTLDLYYALRRKVNNMSPAQLVLATKDWDRLCEELRWTAHAEKQGRDEIKRQATKQDQELRKAQATTQSQKSKKGQATKQGHKSKKGQAITQSQGSKKGQATKQGRKWKKRQAVKKSQASRNDEGSQKSRLSKIGHANWTLTRTKQHLGPPFQPRQYTSWANHGPLSTSRPNTISLWYAKALKPSTDWNSLPPKQAGCNLFRYRQPSCTPLGRNLWALLRRALKL